MLQGLIYQQQYGEILSDPSASGSMMALLMPPPPAPEQRRPPSGTSRRSQEPSQKIHIEGEGMKLADGRIYVPLSFIINNFSEAAEWPLHMQV